MKTIAFVLPLILFNVCAVLFLVWYEVHSTDATLDDMKRVNAILRSDDHDRVNQYLIGSGTSPFQNYIGTITFTGSVIEHTIFDGENNFSTADGRRDAWISFAMDGTSLAVILYARDSELVAQWANRMHDDLINKLNHGGKREVALTINDGVATNITVNGQCMDMMRMHTLISSVYEIGSAHDGYR